jgi:hypothetical protein
MHTPSSGLNTCSQRQSPTAQHPGHPGSLRSAAGSTHRVTVWFRVYARMACHLLDLLVKP